MGRRSARSPTWRTCECGCHRRPLCSDPASPAGVAGVGGGIRSMRSALRTESKLGMTGVLTTLATALCGAGVALLLHVPLPWFTGPLLQVALANMAVRKLQAVPYARDAGQWIIGTALGLYFTPGVVGLVIRFPPWPAANLAVCPLLGRAGAPLLRPFTRGI